MIALMFPGQGAQVVGMGHELAASSAAARAAFDEADQVLGYALSTLCFDGPADRLMQTDVCQPALVATSIAAWRAAEERGCGGTWCMGHSLGEYSALVVAGAISYPDALRLVAERGAAMQAAADASPGAMAACSGRPTRTSRPCAARSATCGRPTSTVRARWSSAERSTALIACWRASPRTAARRRACRCPALSTRRWWPRRRPAVGGIGGVDPGHDRGPLSLDDHLQVRAGRAASAATGRPTGFTCAVRCGGRGRDRPRDDAVCRARGRTRPVRSGASGTEGRPGHANRSAR